MITVAAPVLPVQAASATITVSTTTTEIHVGDTVEVLLTIKADATIGDFEGYLSYDDSILEFNSAASCITTGGAGVLKISDIGASPSAQERSYRIIFNAIDKGECKITMQGRPVVRNFSNGTEMSVTGFSKNILVYPVPLEVPEVTATVTPAPTNVPTPTAGAAKPQEEPLPERVFKIGIVLEGTESDILITEYHRYLVCEKPETFLIPEGYTEMPLLLQGHQITAYAKQGANGEFVLLVLANEYGQVQWYRYDRTEETLQRVSDEEFIIRPEVVENDEAWLETVKEYERYQNGLCITVVVLAGICVFLLTSIVWIHLRNRRQENER